MPAATAASAAAAWASWGTAGATITGTGGATLAPAPAAAAGACATAAPTPCCGTAAAPRAPCAPPPAGATQNLPALWRDMQRERMAARHTLQRALPIVAKVASGRWRPKSCAWRRCCARPPRPVVTGQRGHGTQRGLAAPGWPLAAMARAAGRRGEGGKGRGGGSRGSRRRGSAKRRARVGRGALGRPVPACSGYATACRERVDNIKYPGAASAPDACVGWPHTESYVGCIVLMRRLTRCSGFTSHPHRPSLRPGHALGGATAQSCRS